MIDIIWDMETNDPDDFLTLLFLLGHPDIHLKAVTILPGSRQQVGLVRHTIFEWFGIDIPIGTRNLDSPKSRVSQWHYDAYGDIAPSDEAEPAASVLLEHCDDHTTLLTGAALTNVYAAIRLAQQTGKPFRAGRLVSQGGFAGEGVVPEAFQMEKFRGLTTCPTHNLMADKKAAEAVLVYDHFPRKYFVSKNVCHRLVYDHDMHEIIADRKHRSPALDLIWQGMDVYLKQNPVGKMLHDPLAACCAIDLDTATWREVELFRAGGEWGARLAPDSDTFITIDFDFQKFLALFTAC